MEDTPDFIEHEPHNIKPKAYTTFKIAFHGDDIYTKLVDSEQWDTLSFASFRAEKHFGETFLVIKATYSPRNQRGYLRYIFLILLFDFRYVVMSDKIHTIPGSMNFWKKIRLEGNTECRYINLKTRYNRKYTDQPDSLIWGLDEEYFIDGKINGDFVDDLYKRKVICNDLYNYILQHNDRMRNCNDIRLFTRSTDMI